MCSSASAVWFIAVGVCAYQNVTDVDVSFVEVAGGRETRPPPMAFCRPDGRPTHKHIEEQAVYFQDSVFLNSFKPYDYRELRNAGPSELKDIENGWVKLDTALRSTSGCESGGESSLRLRSSDAPVGFALYLRHVDCYLKGLSQPQTASSLTKGTMQSPLDLVYELRERWDWWNGEVVVAEPGQEPQQGKPFKTLATVRKQWRGAFAQRDYKAQDFMAYMNEQEARLALDYGPFLRRAEDGLKDMQEAAHLAMNGDIDLSSTKAGEGLTPISRALTVIQMSGGRDSPYDGLRAALVQFGDLATARAGGVLSSGFWYTDEKQQTTAAFHTLSASIMRGKVPGKELLSGAAPDPEVCTRLQTAMLATAKRILDAELTERGCSLVLGKGQENNCKDEEGALEVATAIMEEHIGTSPRVRILPDLDDGEAQVLVFKHDHLHQVAKRGFNKWMGSIGVPPTMQEGKPAFLRVAAGSLELYYVEEADRTPQPESTWASSAKTVMEDLQQKMDEARQYPNQPVPSRESRASTAQPRKSEAAPRGSPRVSEPRKSEAAPRGSPRVSEPGVARPPVREASSVAREPAERRTAGASVAARVRAGERATRTPEKPKPVLAKPKPELRSVDPSGSFMLADDLFGNRVPSRAAELAGQPKGVGAPRVRDERAAGLPSVDASKLAATKLADDLFGSAPTPMQLADDLFASPGTRLRAVAEPAPTSSRRQAVSFAEQTGRPDDKVVKASVPNDGVRPTLSDDVLVPDVTFPLLPRTLVRCVGPPKSALAGENLVPCNRDEVQVANDGLVELRLYAPGREGPCLPEYCLELRVAPDLANRLAAGLEQLLSSDSKYYGGLSPIRVLPWYLAHESAQMACPEQFGMLWGVSVRQQDEDSMMREAKATRRARFEDAISAVLAQYVVERARTIAFTEYLSSDAERLLDTIGDVTMKLVSHKKTAVDLAPVRAALRRFTTRKGRNGEDKELKLAQFGSRKDTIGDEVVVFSAERTDKPKRIWSSLREDLLLSKPTQEKVWLAVVYPTDQNEEPALTYPVLVELDSSGAIRHEKSGRVLQLDGPSLRACVTDEAAGRTALPGCPITVEGDVATVAWPDKARTYKAETAFHALRFIVAARYFANLAADARTFGVLQNAACDHDQHIEEGTLQEGVRNYYQDNCAKPFIDIWADAYADPPIQAQAPMEKDWLSEIKSNYNHRVSGYRCFKYALKQYEDAHDPP